MIIGTSDVYILTILIQIIIFEQENGNSGHRFDLVACDSAVAYVIAASGVT